MHHATPCHFPPIVLRENFYYNIHLYIIHVYSPCPFDIDIYNNLSYGTDDFLSSSQSICIKFYQNILYTDIDILPSLSSIIYSRDNSLGHGISILMQAKLENSP